MTMLNIGFCIREEMLKQERSMSWLARKLNKDRSVVYRMLNKNSMTLTHWLKYLVC